MWYDSLPPCQAPVPCGNGQHELRWEAGALHAAAHPDAEAEQVLAVLGGEKAGCIELAEAWGRHTADLSVLTLGPRGPADPVTISWEEAREAAQSRGHAGWAAMSARVAPGIRFPMRPGHGPMQLRQAMQAEREQSQQRIIDQLALLALGTAFQWRLAGHVAAAHADALPAADRPAFSAALSGRLALAMADWIGIDPAQVQISVHDGPGWGSLEPNGTGRLTVAWLADVWACGLALVSGHLVVAVPRPGWPDAQVLALRSPGAEPVLLDVHGTVGEVPYWESRSGG
jgi:hypothetical protein